MSAQLGTLLEAMELRKLGVHDSAGQAAAGAGAVAGQGGGQGHAAAGAATTWAGAVAGLGGGQGQGQAGRQVAKPQPAALPSMPPDLPQLALPPAAAEEHSRPPAARERKRM